MSRVPVKRALVSVYDKAGLIPFVSRLVACGVELVSSGGTARALEEGGLPVVSVSAVTGAAEILGGRVKTLHPHIHGGILARVDRSDDMEDLERNRIEPFQLVVVNLYPFRETVADPGSTEEEIVDKIDIGGPAMVRAAAKNHEHVGVVTSPRQYDEIAEAVEGGGLDDGLRRRLAAEAFFRTSSYDAAIVDWLGGSDTVIPLRQVAELRYGENPHQEAALFVEDGASPWWSLADQLHGKEMSFNNYVDAEAAWRLACDAPAPAVAIIKHTNACGFATADTSAEAFSRAWDCDPLSAFGSVVGVNGALDSDTAKRIADRFVEVVICLSIDAGALDVLSKKRNLRVLQAPPPRPDDRDARRVEHGFLLQGRDRGESDSWEVVSERAPSGDESDQLRLAMTVAMHTKSNAIVVMRDGAAVGVGAGDQSRVGAAERALARAGPRANGAVAASDAFFPFRDGIDALAAAGVTAVIQPGGSRNDQEVIEAANEHRIALVFTGVRHFRH